MMLRNFCRFQNLDWSFLFSCLVSRLVFTFIALYTHSYTHAQMKRYKNERFRLMPVG
jgi:hypothetical protein